MACNCKHCRREIDEGKKLLSDFRKLFISRMTVDSVHHDRRRKDFNQAIFHYEDKEAVDAWNMDYLKRNMVKHILYGQRWIWIWYYSVLTMLYMIGGNLGVMSRIVQENKLI